MSEAHIKFGELLKTERESLKIDLGDLAEQLKISQSHLEAIEKGDLGGVPSELYYGLFAKSYSEALGIDFSRTMDAIKADIGPDFSNGNNKKKDPTAKSEDEEKSADEESGNKNLKNLVRILGLIVIVFIIFIIVNKFFFAGEETGENGSTDNSEQVEQAPASNIPEEDLAGYDWGSAEYKPNEKIRLLLTPRSESWSTIIADGDTVIYKILRVGRTYLAEADYRLLVSVGIPSVVDLNLNGQAVDLVNPETRRISRVEINQMNIENFLNPAETQEGEGGES